MTEDAQQTILGKAVSTRMTQLVKHATRAYRGGDKDSAAFAMAELKDLRGMSGVELTGGVHRDEVRMSALLGARVDEALAEMLKPASEAPQSDANVTN